MNWSDAEKKKSGIRKTLTDLRSFRPMDDTFMARGSF